ncbi:FLYWCH-type domain-containing protein [Aphis craccivora]|uniref:FLYWCH-type domain-containing protein n=1 Tax=Aphis craccivora TaxID=307492 RepID=A0A6G0WXH1_APHCR|nr:FLYWCH-type domain-containing protein [Aphis craccivora]
MYRNNSDFSIFCRKHSSSLAFLPENKVLEGIDFLRTITDCKITDLVDYFDTTYVHKSYRSVQYNPNNGIRFRNIAPLYPPSIWNVYQTTLDNGHRTNNKTKGWNRRFSKLVGHNHPSIWSIWTLIKKMRLELSSDETKLAQFAIGNLSKKKKKTYENMQEKLY